jgi:hypothetical protein
MKKYLLLTGAAFTSMLSIAQPTLTPANTNMVPGEINGTTSYNWVAQGNPGAGQVWNFGAITLNTATFNTTYTVTTPSASVTTIYPNANVMLNGPYGGYVYKTSSTSLQLYGIYDGMGSTYSLINQNPMDMIRYPFTFNNTFTDTYSGTQGPAGTQQFSKGTATVTADGYGTLTVPGGTFSNVLRVYVHTVAKDSSSPSNQINIIKDEYWWFLPNNHYPILQNITTNYGGSITKDLVLLNTITVGISETPSVIRSFNIYPNPSNGEMLNLDLNLTESSKYEIVVIDNLGKEVLRRGSDDVFTGYNLKTLDVSGLESGVYNLGIILKDGKTLNRKFIIQK